MREVYLVALRRWLYNVSVCVCMVGYSEEAYVIKSFRSFAFFNPPKAILVPGMYFLGFSRYSNCIDCKQPASDASNSVDSCAPRYLLSIQLPCSCLHRYTKSLRLVQFYDQRDRADWGRSCCPRLRLRYDIGRIVSSNCQIEELVQSVIGDKGMNTLKRLAPFLSSPITSSA